MGDIDEEKAIITVDRLLQKYVKRLFNADFHRESVKWVKMNFTRAFEGLDEALSLLVWYTCYIPTLALPICWNIKK